ncbi:MAG: HipA family kinase [Dermatophilaceae bacterium]
MGLERVLATRYVLPLREGGSLPGLVEASDDGIYVLKFRGAGQGVKVLVAEIVVGEIARLLDIAVPRLVLVELDAQIARYEADQEVQDLLTASVGLNLGVDFLPGSFGYDGSHPPPADLATRILWLDALTLNVDRTWTNPNLLVWHRHTWAIDHGAALYVHHGWPTRRPDPDRFAGMPFDDATHVLRERAQDPRDVHDELAARLDDPALEAVLALVPDAWLEPTEHLPDPAAVRTAYHGMLRARLSRPQAWLPGRRA